MKYITYAAVIVFLWFGTSVPAHAQTFIPSTGSVGPGGGPCASGPECCNFASGEIHFGCIPVYIGYLIQIAIGFAGGFFFFGIILGGYKFAFKSASQEKQAGIRQLMYSFIGVTVAVLSYLIVDTLMQSLTP